MCSPIYAASRRTPSPNGLPSGGAKGPRPFRSRPKVLDFLAPEADWLDISWCADDDTADSEAAFYRDLSDAEVIWHVLRPLSAADRGRAGPHETRCGTGQHITRRDCRRRRPGRRASRRPIGRRRPGCLRRRTVPPGNPLLGRRRLPPAARRAAGGTSRLRGPSPYGQPTHRLLD